MRSLRQFLLNEKAKGKQIFPPGDEIFTALNATAFDNVNVVILGQDPYHGASQAHGLCFSVKHGVEIPPSLVNIYKELESDLGLMRYLRLKQNGRPRTKVRAGSNLPTKSSRYSMKRRWV